MPAGTDMIRGPRLEFVLRPLKGKVKRIKHSFDPKAKKNVTQTVSEDAGFMLYTPQGQSYRLSPDEARKRGYVDRIPTIINFDKVNDTKSAAGRYKFAQTDAQRQKAWKELEDEVIKACVRRHGPTEPVTTGEDNVSKAA